MPDVEEPAEAVTVFIGSLPAGKQRSFLVACSMCGGGYYLAARTVREMRQTGRAPVCRQCRRPADLVTVTPRHIAWAQGALDAMTPVDRELVVLAFSPQPLDPTRVRDLALAASAS